MTLPKAEVIPLWQVIQMLKQFRIKILRQKIVKIEIQKHTLEETMSRNIANSQTYISKLIKLTQNLQKKRQKLRQLTNMCNSRL